MVLIHMIPAYQVWSQPHFEFVELNVNRTKNWPKFLGRGWWLKLWYRSFYVCLLTFLAVLLPFFNVVLGFVGAVGFWYVMCFKHGKGDVLLIHILANILQACYSVFPN